MFVTRTRRIAGYMNLTQTNKQTNNEDDELMCRHKHHEIYRNNMQQIVFQLKKIEFCTFYRKQGMKVIYLHNKMKEAFMPHITYIYIYIYIYIYRCSRL